MDRAQRARAAATAVELIAEVGEISREIERRRALEGAEEFVGRSYMAITGYYEGKAGDEEGILIEGVAAPWTQDREDEEFARGAFDAGIAKFMENPILVYSHSKPVLEEVHITDGGKSFTDTGRQSGYLQLGVVKALWKDAKRGLMARAWFPKPAADDHPIIRDVYKKVKSGMMKGLSIGGKFKSLGSTIVDCDIQELSIAPRPIHPEALVTKVTPGRFTMAPV